MILSEISKLLEIICPNIEEVEYLLIVLEVAKVVGIMCRKLLYKHLGEK